MARYVTIADKTGRGEVDGLVVFSSGSVEAQNPIIEARHWPTTGTFGAGENARCTCDKGDATRLVSFHNASGRYSRGDPITRPARIGAKQNAREQSTLERWELTRSIAVPRLAPKTMATRYR